MAKLTNGNISYWRMSCRFRDNNTTINKIASEIEKAWMSRLGEDNLQQSQQARESIVQWLLTTEKENWDCFTRDQQKVKAQGFQYRYQILKQRYLDVTLTQAHRNLMQRTSSIVVLHYNLKGWLSANRDGQLALLEVIQEVIQDLLEKDRHLQEQMTRIAQCTSDESLRNRLLFASVEEYCLPATGNQSSFIEYFNHYLRSHRNNTNVLQLIENLMLDEGNHAMKFLENQEVYQFSKVMLEVRYPLFSA